MLLKSVLAIAACLSSASAAYKGFNYGSTQSDGSYKYEADYEAEFNIAKNLPGTSGFTSARLYTTIQGGTANSPTSAIQAAINTQTTLLLGLWCSSGDAVFGDELAALSSAIAQYGTAFTDLVAGISVGSEDLYRITDLGASIGPGASPDQIVNYISQLRNTIAGTSLAGAQVTHVDTWTAWVNGSNAEVINAVDFIGFDAYPYYQFSYNNPIEEASNLFWQAYADVSQVTNGKAIWVTETGWPTVGPTYNLATAGVGNLQTYWNWIGCGIFDNLNTYWYTLQDSYPVTGAVSFGVVDAGANPVISLSC